jgi:hypothetical protein
VVPHAYLCTIGFCRRQECGRGFAAEGSIRRCFHSSHAPCLGTPPPHRIRFEDPFSRDLVLATRTQPSPSRGIGNLNHDQRAPIRRILTTVVLNWRPGRMSGAVMTQRTPGALASGSSPSSAPGWRCGWFCCSASTHTVEKTMSSVGIRFGWMEKSWFPLATWLKMNTSPAET